MTPRPVAFSSLVFGVVDAPSRTPPHVAEKLRDLTVSWCRYGYRGPILLASSVDAVLRKALERGYRHCFIQFAGHVIRERWAPDGPAPDLPALLTRFAESEQYLVAGYITGDDTQWYGLAARCMLVDVTRHATLGSPPFGDSGALDMELPRCSTHRSSDGAIAALAPADGSVGRCAARDGWNLVASSLRAGLPVRSLSAVLSARTLDIGAEHAEQAASLSLYLGFGIESLRSANGHTHIDPALSPDQREFLGVIARQTGNAQRGVFLWNIEPYGDIVKHVPERPRTATLYAVAAGFKPNAILQAHGFDADAQVVFFDYSERALAIRRHMVEQWNGEDFPGFVRYLVRTFPAPQTYYHLPGDSSPDGIDWRVVEQAWQRELDWWGGAERFRDHWQAYRRLPHRYLLCNLLEDPTAALRAMAANPRSGDIVWWSNAFFTMYGNWFHSPTERQHTYERWMSGIAEASPHALLYGSDYANANVNAITAGEYWAKYQQLAPDHLEPAALHRTEIRM
jgi:hypothetical protein